MLNFLKEKNFHAWKQKLTTLFYQYEKKSYGKMLYQLNILIALKN